MAWRIDYSCNTCLHNWVERLSLTCEPKWKIGWIGSSLWLGWVFTLLFIPRLADKYGRHWIYTIGMLLLLPVFITTMCSHSIDLTIVCILLQGMLSTVRVSIGFVYMMEFVTKQRQTAMCTVFSMQPPIITLLATLYFSTISKHWFWFVFIGLLSLVMCCIFSFYIPESPKYLFK